ncbi:MAG: PQQ-binding-like beta-propeller repeat protein, partial [Candidatus Asgardarchaeum sp.]
NGTVLLMSIHGNITATTDIGDLVNLMYTYDINNDSYDDVIIGGYYGNVICLSGKDLSLIWKSSVPTDSITSIKILDLYDDKTLVYIIVASEDESVYALRLDGSIYWSVNLGSDVLGLTAAFYPYTDSRNVIATTENGTIWVIYGKDGTITDKFTFWSNVKIRDLAAIDIDNDHIEELIIPGKNLILLNETKGIVWNNTDVIAPGYRITLADINTDGVYEIIASNVNFSGTGSEFICVDSLHGGTLWQRIMTNSFIWSFSVTSDFNNDGFMDIVAGLYGYFSPVIVYSGKDGSIISIYGKKNIVMLVDVDSLDIDSDGQTEILAGGAYYYVSLVKFVPIGKVYRAEVEVHSPILTITDFEGDGGTLIASGYIDADDYEDIIVAINNSYVFYISVYEKKIVAGWDSRYGKITALDIAEIPGKVAQGIVVGTNYGYIIYLTYEGGDELKVQWYKKIATGYIVSSIACGDYDKDDKVEIAAGFRDESSTSGFISMIDDDGTIVWSNSDPKRGVQEVRAFDSNLDQVPDHILAYALDHAIYLIKTSSGATGWYVNVSPYFISSMDIGDTNTDGYAEIVIGLSKDDSGGVSLMKESGAVFWTKYLAYPVYSVSIGNFTIRDEPSIAVLDNVSRILYLNGSTGAAYQILPTNVLVSTYRNATSKSIIAIDIDGDDLHELLVLNLKRAFVIDGNNNIVWSTDEMYDYPVSYTIGNFDNRGCTDMAFVTSNGLIYVFSDHLNKIKATSSPMRQETSLHTLKAGNDENYQSIAVLELRLGLISIFVAAVVVARKKRKELRNCS